MAYPAALSAVSTGDTILAATINNIETTVGITDAMFPAELHIVPTATTGYGLSVTRNLAAASTDSPLIYFHQDHAGDDQSLLHLVDDKTGAATYPSLYYEFAGTGGLAEFDINGVLSTDVNGFLIYSNAVQNGGARGLFSVNQDNASSTGRAIYINNDGTGNGILIDQNGDGEGLVITSDATTASKYALNINTGSATGRVALFHTEGVASAVVIEKTNVGAGTALSITNNGTGEGILLTQGGAGYGLEIAQNGNNSAIYIDSAATSTRTVQIISTATSAQGLYVEHSGTGTSQRIYNTDAGYGLQIENTAADESIMIDHNNIGAVINIDQDVNSASACYGLQMNIANAGAGLEYAFKFDGSEKGITAAGNSGFVSNNTGTFTVVGYIRVDVGGSEYRIPYGTIA